MHLYKGKNGINISINTYFSRNKSNSNVLPLNLDVSLFFSLHSRLMVHSSQFNMAQKPLIIEAGAYKKLNEHNFFYLSTRAFTYS